MSRLSSEGAGHLVDAPEFGLRSVRRATTPKEAGRDGEAEARTLEQRPRYFLFAAVFFAAGFFAGFLAAAFFAGAFLAAVLRVATLANVDSPLDAEPRIGPRLAF